MINSKETLKKLHQKFPNLNLDDLFDILDCYVETGLFNYYDPNKMWYLDRGDKSNITYNDGTNTSKNVGSGIQLAANH